MPLPSLSLAVPGGSGLAEYLERLAALPRCVAVARASVPVLAGGQNQWDPILVGR